jgi:hypothetical protein
MQELRREDGGVREDAATLGVVGLAPSLDRQRYSQYRGDPMHPIVPAIAALLLSATSVYADCLTGPVAGQWSGTGDRTTEPFATTGAPVKMTFTTTSKYGNPQLCYRVRSLDAKLGPGGCAQQEAGETFLYLPAGTYYLEISTSGDYTVTLEQTG